MGSESVNSISHLNDRTARLALVLGVLLLAVASCLPYRPIPKGAESKLVTAALVEANNALFTPGPEAQEAPALVVFSLDPDVWSPELRQLARRIYSMKGREPAADDLKPLVEMVTDETHHADQMVKVPDRLGYGSRIYMADVWIERTKLKAGYLRSPGLLRFRVYLVEGRPYTTRLVSDTL